MADTQGALEAHSRFNGCSSYEERGGTSFQKSPTSSKRSVVSCLRATTLLVVQNFPPLDGPLIGKEVIPSHGALIAHFAATFIPIRCFRYEDTLKAANDNWFIDLFSVRA